MDLIRQYIVQCLITAANNLRLNSERIETIAIFREFIIRHENIGIVLAEMKKVTELSTLAIKINEIYNFLSNGKIDFLRLSDKFKEHCHLIHHDLNHLLERNSPVKLREILSGLEEKISGSSEIIPFETKSDSSKFDNCFENVSVEPVPQIADCDNTEQSPSYSEIILGTVKESNEFLDRLSHSQSKSDEYGKFILVMRKNAGMAMNMNHETVCEMHGIFADILFLIDNNKLELSNDAVKALRSCLIVIVALTKGKDVDIKNYIEAARNFLIKHTN